MRHRALKTRLHALEEVAGRQPDPDAPDLTQLTDDELEELEPIARTREVGGALTPELERRERYLVTAATLRSQGVFLPDNGR